MSKPGPKSKITNSQKNEIVNLCLAGSSVREIAFIMDISKSTVHRIILEALGHND